jgi:hypothetical protein
MIKAFETQIIEIETLFIRKDFGHAHAVVSLHFFYRVKPELAFHSYEYQHKGPIYSGMADITLRAYTWDDNQIKKYKDYRNDDDLELATTIDKSLEEAMNALGDDLKKYLKEAGEDLPFPGDKPKADHGKAEASYPSILDPFISVFSGFGELFKGMVGGAAKPAKKEEKHEEHKHDYKDHVKSHRATHFATEAAWEAYYRYKMGPGNNLYWVE